MRHLLIRQRVANYAQWRAFYDEQRPSREAAGLLEREVFRNLNDPDEVFLLFGFDDLMRAEEYVASAGPKARMTAAGVLDEPDYYFLT